MQQLSFDTLPANSMSIGNVATTLQVSESSVRNWIKAGYLELQDNGFITKTSYNEFSKIMIGVDKLTARANKSNLDSHDHCKLQGNFQTKFKNMGSIALQMAGDDYEKNLSFSYRNKEGIYYTPLNIVKLFFDFAPTLTTNLFFCDPCCGSGNFVMAALDNGFSPQNVYGFDTDPIAIEITKARIKDKYGFDTQNIMTLDFLEYIIIKRKIKIPTFDVIFTNPPWGKRLDSNLREKITYNLNCPKHSDTSSIFLQSSLHIAKQDAVIGMLLPEAFFNISGFSHVRKIVSDYSMVACIDFGKAFKGLMTSAQALIIENTPCKNKDKRKVFCKYSSKSYFRNQASFKNNPKSIFNFLCTDEEHKVIQHVYNKKHLTLKGQASWAMGIVTGNNKKFIRPKSENGYIPVYKGVDIKPNQLAIPQNFIPNDLSLYQQSAPRDFYLAKEKLVYRFISSDLVFYHDVNKEFFLNSANMLILNKDFPVDYEKLAWLLNTNLINWLFKKTFNTCKILRSDIETLPIFHHFLASTKVVNETELLNYLGIERSSDGTYRIKG